VLEPVAFLRRLAALVPPVRQNQVRYYGLLAAQACDRGRLLALVPSGGKDGDGGREGDGDSGSGHAAADPFVSPASACYRVRWAKLLARVFGHQV
jgi:hypothetical protein